LCKIAALAHKLINNWQFCKLSLVFNNNQYLLNNTNAYKQCSVRFYLQLFVVGLMHYLRYCVCLRIVVSNTTYCFVSLLCFSSTCVSDVTSLFGLSIVDCPFAILIYWPTLTVPETSCNAISFFVLFQCRKNLLATLIIIMFYLEKYLESDRYGTQI
jgi:hypothetical protein